jgi:hypothetical protein
MPDLDPRASLARCRRARACKENSEHRRLSVPIPLAIPSYPVISPLVTATYGTPSIENQCYPIAKARISNGIKGLQW